jgi:Family of unknown function (DUF6998)
MSSSKTVKIGTEFVKKITLAIDAALAYEAATRGKRKLGITGEVGEILACHQLGLELVIDPRSRGYDAIDKNRKRVEIKTRRSEQEGLPKDAGRTSRFSEHKFDYALLVLLDHKYQLSEIWKADFSKLNPIIESQKRRNPNLSSFKRAGKLIFQSS